ncbi:MAG: hypothetical protein J6N76_09140 [Lachnospiraceae bacterium]|nr:hypothetical protein [Lachnospiraceae bacterium]
MDVNGYEGLVNTGRAQEAAAAKNSGYVTGKEIGGRTVGQPKLSEEAKKYYDELRKKYGDMDFVLVSADQKQYAQANAASYARSDKTVVLIDEEKIEKMAADEGYRKQIEGQIQNASKQLPQLAEQLKASGANIAGFGMQVNDNGTVSFFAAMQKSSEAQTRRIAEKREAKAAQKKAEAKKEAKEAQAERIEERRAQNDRDPKKPGRASEPQKEEAFDPKQVEVLKANSIEELMKRIEEYNYNERSNSVFSEQELKVGGNIDFKG